MIRALPLRAVECAGERNSAPEFGQPNPARRPSVGRREDDKICPFGDVHMVASDRDIGNRAVDRSNQFRSEPRW